MTSAPDGTTPVTASSQDQVDAASAVTAGRPANLARQLATFGFDIGAPIAAYYLLHGLGVNNLVALGAGAVFPALGAGYSLAVKRRADTVSLLVLGTLGVSILTAVISRDPRFLLTKEGLITGLWGAWFLASVWARRPAAFLFARPFMEGRRAFAVRDWDALWQVDPRFRRLWRVSSVIWGLGILGDAAVRVVMAYTLPIHVVPGLSGALWPVTFIVLQVVTNIYYMVAGLNRMLGARWLGRRANAPGDVQAAPPQVSTDSSLDPSDLQANSTDRPR
ncbi:hypothetical protein KO481_10260 [Nocardia sp. NEAU-G5]|uniref:Intracellular septation protein A n=1 Tax=Nocardia albiluteola TaxID=2842303 RepID=A0ABS6AV50_9NOCA|nr:VC0807 family protein [Nocardia albiluteola]MBU3061908.1 hypothetical protein [Nocardia albiluteola]